MRRSVSVDRLLFILDNLNSNTEVGEPAIEIDPDNYKCIIKIKIGVISYQVADCVDPLESVVRKCYETYKQISDALKKQ